MQSTKCGNAVLAEVCDLVGDKYVLLHQDLCHLSAHGPKIQPLQMAPQFDSLHAVLLMQFYCVHL